jgi:hypothetical protein
VCAYSAVRQTQGEVGFQIKCDNEQLDILVCPVYLMNGWLKSQGSYRELGQILSKRIFPLFFLVPNVIGAIHFVGKSLRLV